MIGPTDLLTNMRSTTQHILVWFFEIQFPSCFEKLDWKRFTPAGFHADLYSPYVNNFYFRCPRVVFWFAGQQMCYVSRYFFQSLQTKCLNNLIKLRLLFFFYILCISLFSYLSIRRCVGLMKWITTNTKYCVFYNNTFTHTHATDSIMWLPVSACSSRYHQAY